MTGLSTNFAADESSSRQADVGLPDIPSRPTGPEAVESAIKSVKGVPDGQAGTFVCADNFRGRTLGIAGFSTDAAARECRQ
jgi:acetylornithine/succinyldiaminopimelate/putrescine aminotransferase